MAAETARTHSGTNESRKAVHGDPGAVSGAVVPKEGKRRAGLWKWIASVTGIHLVGTFGGDLAFGFPVRLHNVVFAVALGLLTGIVVGPILRWGLSR